MINKLTPGHNLRWESSRMMLPEHKEGIIAHNKTKTKVSKPTLDESQLQDMDEKILQAMEFHLTLKFAVWNDGVIRNMTGTIERLDDINKCMWIHTNDGVNKIRYDCIINVDFAD